ncbi:MAG: cytochrome c oxidase subunit II [Thermoleophilia bacterium]|nr:cytochrome c oxidase subunit II [Thermoleophilia bacterium]
MKNRHLVPLVVLHLIIGALTAAVIFLIDWWPDQAAEQAPRVDGLMWFLVISSGVIFTGVTSFLVYALWRFRAAPGDESDGPPHHGNTKLEIAWTVIPVILLAVIAVWSIAVTGKNEKKDPNREVIQVRAWQFAWEFTYPDSGFTTGDLRVPSGRQVELQMRSSDVIHNLWVPEFRVKQDVVPGVTTELLVNPTKVGTYDLICAELCGAGHGIMRSRAIVMESSAYDAWKRQSAADAKATAAAASSPSAGSTSDTPPAG